VTTGGERSWISAAVSLASSTSQNSIASSRLHFSCGRLLVGIVNDKERSHQQSQTRVLRGVEFRADAPHSHRTSEIKDILEVVVVGEAREIAIAREVGDSVLYHSQSDKELLFD